MNNFSLLLLALPAVVIFGITIYLKNIHENMSKEHALANSWTYGIVAAGFFVLIFIAKFTDHI